MRPNQTYKLLDCKTIKKQRNKEKSENTTSGKEENNGKLCNQQGLILRNIKVTHTTQQQKKKKKKKLKNGQKT